MNDALQGLPRKESLDGEREKSEERHRSLLDNLQVAVVEHSTDTSILFCNRQALLLLGLEKDEATGRFAADPRWVLYREDGTVMPLEEFPVVRVLNTLEPLKNFVLGVQQPDSQKIVWALVDAFPLFDEENALKTILVTFLDITERRRAEESRLEHEQRFNDLVNSTDGIFWEADATDFGFISVSDNAERMLGYSTEDWLKPGFWVSHIHPNDLEQAVQYCSACTGRAENHTFEYRFIAADGRIVWLRDIVAVVTENAQPRWLRGLMIDITERKLAEEEKLGLERQIQQGQKLESLGVLAGGIAHDFNNILTTILGNADLAMEGLSPHSPARSNIQNIEKASRRAADLAKQMLAYSGKGKFVVEPIDLGEFVEEMAHLLAVSISKSIVLNYNFADNLPAFDGDPTQVRQIIMNLILNSAEAIGKRSGVIALSTGAMHCDRAYLQGINTHAVASFDAPLVEGVYVYLEVADTGCGMDLETIEKIFDPFFTMKFTGRGLGMSATLGIVRGHKGAIKIDSEVGKGTTFKVLFPASKLPANGTLQAEDGDEGVAATWQGEGTILIVDDEETICAMGRQMVEHMGFSAMTAADGREAVEVFGNYHKEIACVLLDLTMPHMGGEEAFRELRRIQPDVKVILCSGYGMQDATQFFIGQGLAGFLQKPYKMSALKETLAQLLGSGVKGGVDV